MLWLPRHKHCVSLLTVAAQLEDSHKSCPTYFLNVQNEYINNVPKANDVSASGVVTTKNPEDCGDSSCLDYQILTSNQRTQDCELQTSVDVQKNSQDCHQQLFNRFPALS